MALNPIEYIRNLCFKSKRNGFGVDQLKGSGFRQSSISIAMEKYEKKPLSKINTKPYRVKIATSTTEKKKVYQLAYETYVNKGYIERNEKKEYTLPADNNKDTAILIVEDLKGKLLGSITIVTDHETPFPSSELFNEELESIKEKGSIAEYTRFVINEENRNSKEILSLMMNYAYMYAYHLMGADTIICEVNPRHKFFYLKSLKFKQLGETKSCAIVKGAPAVFMYQEGADCRALINECRLNHDPKYKRLLYHHFMPLDEEENALLNLRKYNNKKLSRRKKYSVIYSDSGSLRAI